MLSKEEIEEYRSRLSQKEIDECLRCPAIVQNRQQAPVTGTPLHVMATAGSKQQCGFEFAIIVPDVLRSYGQVPPDVLEFIRLKFVRMVMDPSQTLALYDERWKVLTTRHLLQFRTYGSLDALFSLTERQYRDVLTRNFSMAIGINNSSSFRWQIATLVDIKPILSDHDIVQ